MSAESTAYGNPAEIKISTAVALSGGQVLQAPDGRAAFYNGLNAAAADDIVTLQVAGQANVAKSTSVVFLPGQEVWWDAANNQATYRLAGTYYVGVCVLAAAVADEYVKTELNAAKPLQGISLESGRGLWTVAATNGLSVTQTVRGAYKAAFDTATEAAMAAIYSDDTIPLAQLQTFEAEVAIFDIGDNAALDINCGIANGTHATDFDSVTESCLIHLDGSALDIKAESDDGTTEVNATDTTVNAVDDTYFFVQMDFRDIDDIQIYINGANVLPASVFKLDAATGPFKPILHIEKTSDDTPADVRVREMCLRGRYTS